MTILKLVVVVDGSGSSGSGRCSIGGGSSSVLRSRSKVNVTRPYKPQTINAL